MVREELQEGESQASGCGIRVVEGTVAILEEGRTAANSALCGQRHPDHHIDQCAVSWAGAFVHYRLEEVPAGVVDLVAQHADMNSMSALRGLSQVGVPREGMAAHKAQALAVLGSDGVADTAEVVKILFRSCKDG